ncbi:hypothetical protein COO60DRAFT_1698071 [Scenedesmus sp. NREL 46B-D3]|nr:hypothetical protein COO60DRAFT_1698071 [Scenedesmus sp. NREL 46B-D3]
MQPAPATQGQFKGMQASFASNSSSATQLAAACGLNASNALDIDESDEATAAAAAAAEGDAAEGLPAVLAGGSGQQQQQPAAAAGAGPQLPDPAEAARRMLLELGLQQADAGLDMVIVHLDASSSTTSSPQQQQGPQGQQKVEGFHSAAAAVGLLTWVDRTLRYLNNSSAFKDTPAGRPVLRPLQSWKQLGDGLYYIFEDVLKSLAPDVIITQSLCSVCSVDLKLVEKVVQDMRCSSANGTTAAVQQAPRIVSLNPFNIEDVLQDAVAVGEALGLQRQAAAAVAALPRQPPLAAPVVVFLEWFEPLFPGGHWTPQLIHMAGEGRQGCGPSRPVWNDDLVALDPDWIIICPCGLDIAETVKELPPGTSYSPLTASGWWPQLKAVQAGRVALVDGNQMFNRPGPRLVDCLEFLVGLLHQQHDVIPANFPWRFYKHGELAEAEEKWLQEHPGWKTRVQEGPPKAAWQQRTAAA